MQNTNKILVQLLFLLCASLHAAQEEPIDVGRYPDGIIWVNPGRKDLSLLTPAEQAEVFRRLRAQFRDPDPAIRFSSGISLLQLGDAEGITYAMKLYHQPLDWINARQPESQYLAEGELETEAAHGNAAMLPYLMDDAINGPTEGRAYVDGGDMPGGQSFRNTSSLMAMRTILESSAFPPATRAWAKQAHKIVYEGFIQSEKQQAREQLKLWWEHNKAAILAKDYAKATWLPTTAGQAPPALSAPAKNPAPVSLTTPSPAPSESSPALKWLLLAAATLAALGLGWRLLRRK